MRPSIATVAPGGVAVPALGAHSRRQPDVGRHTAERQRAALARDSTARAAIAIGIATLPILRPAVGGNLGPADAGILIGVGGTILWAGATKQVLRLAYATPVALVIIAGMVSGLAGADPGAALLAVAQDAYLAVWALACLNLGRTAAAAGFLARAWCVTAAIWAVALFVIVGRTVLTATGDTRLAFTADSNGAGFYFVISIFVILAARWPRRPVLRYAAIAFLLADTVLTGSLGALSGLLGGLAVSVVLRVFHRRGAAPAVACGVALLLAAGSGLLYAQRAKVVDAAHASNNAIVRNSIGRGAQSSGERAELTKETTGLVNTSGLLGSGPNTTEQLLRDQQAPYPKQAHNDWIAALVERGVLGLGAVALLTMDVGARALSVRDSSHLDERYAAVLPAAYHLTGALVTVGVFSFTHEVLHDRTAWTLFGLVAVFAVYGRRQAPPLFGRPTGNPHRARTTGGQPCAQS
jgi:hypothetical protein